MTRSTPLFFLAALAAGCAPPPGGTPADVAAVAAVVQAYSDATVAGDAPRLLDMLTEDVVLMPPGQPPVVGRDAARSWLRWFSDLFTVMSRTSTIEETIVIGDWAYSRGSYMMQYEPVDAEPITESGKFSGLMRRQPDGSWKIARDMWNVTTTSDTGQ